MDFTRAQQDAIDLTCNLVVTAGAGSGKTRVLVERYLRLLSEGVQPFENPPAAALAENDILAITFTEKAAREMRNRVREAVEQRARQSADPAERVAWEEQRAAVEAARIGTIHSFCAALLRAQPAESGLDPQFRVLDEVQQALLLAESVDTALRAVASQAAQAELPNVQMTTLQAIYTLDELRAILANLVRGGAEVRATIAAMPDTPAELLAHWHDRLHAAQQTALRELRANPNWRTASDTVLRLAPGAPADDNIGKQFHLLATCLAELNQQQSTAPVSATLPDVSPVNDIKLTGGKQKEWGGKEALAEAKDALRMLRDTYRAQADLLTFAPDDGLEQQTAAATVALCAVYRRVLAEYTRRKEQQDALDYDDLEHRARELLEQHAYVRERWRDEFQAVLVDEFQDTNDEQRAIIYELTGLQASGEEPVLHPDSPRLFVVGDGKQSIYRFRGADVSVFRAVENNICQQGGQTVALDTSFRTHLPLLNWINTVMQKVFARERPLLPYEVPFERLEAHRPAPTHQRCVELHIIDNAENADSARQMEGEVLAKRLIALTDDNAERLIYDRKEGEWRVPKPGDIAILCQASTVFEYYEAALQKAEIPYLTTAGRGYYGRQEVIDLIHLLRVLNDTDDNLALVGVLRSPLFALDDATLLHLHVARKRSLWEALMSSDASAVQFARSTLQRLHALRGRLTVVELLRAALEHTGYLATISGLERGAQRRVNVEKLIETARLVGNAGLLAFSAYLEDLLKAEPREGEAPLEAQGSVRLMTVHRSKGLEFPIVVLPDLGRKSIPQRAAVLARRSYGVALRMRDTVGDTLQPMAYQLARREEQHMEQAERERLLYVALTRAQDYVILSGQAASSNNDSWLSRLLHALGTPWENDGPAAGSQGALEVWRHVAASPTEE